jgi:hypothetical protein
MLKKANALHGKKVAQPLHVPQKNLGSYVKNAVINVLKSKNC